MHIPIKAALFGLNVLGNLFSGGEKPAPQQAQGLGSAAFNDTMKIAGLIQQVGERLTVDQHKTLDQLVASGQIPQALDMLQRMANGQPLGAALAVTGSAYPNGIPLR